MTIETSIGRQSPSSGATSYLIHVASAGYGRRLFSLAAALCVLAIVGSGIAADSPRSVRPEAVVDLRSAEGIKAVSGHWKYSDTQIQQIPHRDVGLDLKASGRTNVTYDFYPDARGADYDDSAWETIDPSTLEARRGHGRLSLNWYRLYMTVPEKIGDVETRGKALVFEIVVDDYAEVWVNGRLPFALGQNGGTIVAGWNAPNRVLLTRDAKPGADYSIAILGINGPISTHPDTYIWVRSATLELLPSEADLAVVKLGDTLDSIVPAKPRLEKVAGGFGFTEGPVWIPGGAADFGPDANEGYLLFSDPNNNTIYRMTPDGDVSVFIPKSGYTGRDIGEYRQPGSNGLAIDSEGRLTLCQHGNRRVVRIEKNGTTTVMADRYEDKRLNSPNDLVYKKDGALYFTDPPFGLPHFADDRRRELSISGVYVTKNGKTRLAAADFAGPNGLAFSPDEMSLYVGNWEDKRKVILRYPVQADGSLGKGELFADLTDAPGDDAIDGIKTDQAGNLYVSGPGGLWILDSRGKRLGLFHCPEHPHNLAWGGPDRRTLYLAAETSIYRIDLRIPGAGAWPEAVMAGKR